MPDGGAPGPSLSWLDRPLPPPRGGPADARLAQVRSLSNKGEYEQAARVAEAILAEGAGEAQALSRYLFGVFLARGFVVLPRVLDAIRRACEAAFATGEKRAAADAEASLGWLCRTARDRVDFHQAQKDATWRGWVDASDTALCEAIGEACARLAAVVGAVAPGSQSLESVAGIHAFARGTLRGLIPRPAPPPPPPPTPPPPAVVEAPAVAEEPEEEPLPPRVHAPSPVASASDDDSAAMALLRRKLAGFQELLDRGDLARAAIVARDLESTIERFDPRVYLPRLFAPYYRRLASSGEELTPHWEAEGSLGARALSQLYQVDLEAFLEADDER